MSKDEVLQRFSKIIAEHGCISSDQYDQLTVDRPSRWTLRQHFGSWKDSLAAAVDKLGIKVPDNLTPEPIPEHKYNEEVQKLTQQVHDLTRHIQTPALHLDGTTHKFGILSDSHVGSLYADMALLGFAYDVFESEGVRIVFNAGDILDGIKMYRGHDYELMSHGADNQVGLCADSYPKRDGITTYFITGNHDRSFWKHGGTEVGSKIAEKRSDLIHLGYQEADIIVGDDGCQAKVRLFHPEDGSMSYAISYKPQRYISELPSGTKPDILIIGHYHKSEMLFYRGVTTIQAGTTQKQTAFMRGKRISAAVGFWLCEVVIGPNRVISVKGQFFPIRS